MTAMREVVEWVAGGCISVLLVAGTIALLVVGYHLTVYWVRMDRDEGEVGK